MAAPQFGERTGVFVAMTEPSDDMGLLAAEYVLRLLDADEMSRAERLLVEDASFALAVHQWQARFASFADELEEVEPRAAVKTAVLDRLFGQPEHTSFWSGLAFWRGLALASVVALAAMIWINVSRDGPDTGPIYVAEITSTAQDFRVVAIVDKSTNEVILTKTAGAAPEGRILQVWAHGPDKPAQSVGLWPEGDSIRLAMSDEIAAVDDILTLGVSEEPVGGSLTGLPSGRIFGTVDIQITSPPL